MAKCLFPETTGQESSKPVASGTRSSSDMRNAFGALFQGDLAPLRPRAQSTPDMTVAVNPALVQSFFSQVWLGTTTPLSYAGGNSGSVSAPSSNPRIDLLTIDSSGTLAWTTGSEGASPTAPDCPAGKMPICYIYCKTTMTKIVNYEDKDANPNEGYIYKDVRPFLNMGGTDEKVKASSGDSTADYLDGKVDDFTIEVASDKLKVKDRIELNIMLLAFKMAVQDGLVKFNMVDGFMDEFEDESGVDTANCSGQTYDASGDYYYNTPGGWGATTKLMCHFNSGSTAETGQTITLSSASISGTSPKFGAGSLYFSATNQYASIPDSSDWDIGSNAFTFQCWVKVTDASSWQWLVMSGTSNYWGLYVNGGNICTTGFGGSTLSGAISNGTWTHVAVVGDGSNVHFFVDGVDKGNMVQSVANPSGAFYIGTNSTAVGSQGFAGYVDEMRFENGVANKFGQANVFDAFTPPSSEYTVGTVSDMTLVSNTVTAEAEPSNSRIVLYEEDVDSITVNTDIKAYVSIDGGSNYDQVTLTDEGDYDSGKRILTGIVDVSARTGTSVKWKVTTHNSKNLKLHAVGGTWD